MTFETAETDVLSAIEALVDRLEIAVDADQLARAFRLRERILAKTMAPLRAFDESMLYLPQAQGDAR